MLRCSSDQAARLAWVSCHEKVWFNLRHFAYCAASPTSSAAVRNGVDIFVNVICFQTVVVHDRHSVRLRFSNHRSRISQPITCNCIDASLFCTCGVIGHGLRFVRCRQTCEGCSGVCHLCGNGAVDLVSAVLSDQSIQPGLGIDPASVPACKNGGSTIDAVRPSLLQRGSPCLSTSTSPTQAVPACPSWHVPALSRTSV